MSKLRGLLHFETKRRSYTRWFQALKGVGVTLDLKHAPRISNIQISSTLILETNKYNDPRIKDLKGDLFGKIVEIPSYNY